MNLHTKYKTILSKAGINTPLRLAYFFAQIDHESGLKPVSESFNYSPKRLVEVFPKYFPTIESARKIIFRTEIANKVYANRMGNGNEQSGDGYRFRGRGFIQITGYDNYKNLSTHTGVNYVKNPDLLLNEADAMISAIWYWEVSKLNQYADKDDLDSVSDLINIGRKTVKIGDANGYAHRLERLNHYKKFFNA